MVEPSEKITDLDAIVAEGDDEISMSGDEDIPELDIEWVKPTVLKAPGLVEEKLLAHYQKYFDKNRESKRIWTRATTMVIDEENSEEDYVSGDDEQVDEDVRVCYVSKPTDTFEKLSNKMNGSNAINDLSEAFFESYPGYSEVINQIEDYEYLMFEPGMFLAKHFDAVFSQDENYRKISVIGVLSDSATIKLNGSPIELKKGDLLMFPSCPLHEWEIEPVTKETILFTNFLI